MCLISSHSALYPQRQRGVLCCSNYLCLLTHVSAVLVWIELCHGVMFASSTQHECMHRMQRRRMYTAQILHSCRSVPPRFSQFLAMASLVSQKIIDLRVLWTYLEPNERKIHEAYYMLLRRYEAKLKTVSVVDLSGKSNLARERFGQKRLH